MRTSAPTFCLSRDSFLPPEDPDFVEKLLSSLVNEF